VSAQESLLKERLSSLLKLPPNCLVVKQGKHNRHILLFSNYAPQKLTIEEEVYMPMYGSTGRLPVTKADVEHNRIRVVKDYKDIENHALQEAAVLLKADDSAAAKDIMVCFLCFHELHATD